MAGGVILRPNAQPLLPSTNLRRQVAEIVKANIRQLLTDILADQLGHAMAVAAGRTHFREIFTRTMGAYWGNSRGDADHMANVVYDCVERAWKDAYQNQSAFAFLDAVHVPSPESDTERERAIEDAWEVEIASSEAVLNRYYRGSARVRKGRDIFSSAWMRGPERPQ